MRKFLLVLSLFVFEQSAWAQERVVSGKVTQSEDGSTLSGVTVVVKGTANGTVTDAEGMYKITVPSSGTTLVFSFIGQVTQETLVGERSVIDIRLQTDVKQLSEVVVNAIGDEVPKDKLGQSSATVAGPSVVSSGETGIINGLEGKAPGLNITRNGSDPGAGSFMQIRGQSTITGDIQPLIVIDGMPMFNTFVDQGGGNQVDGVQQQSRLNDLNPDDIASIEVIKSAGGAAIWGSRAANGVIVITTKKGKNTRGKINVSYSATVDFDQVNKMPSLQRTFGQGGSIGGQETPGVYTWNSSYSFGDKISTRSGGPDAYATSNADPNYKGYAVLPNGATIYRIDQKNSQATFDHTKDIFRTGNFVEHNLNLSGGSERSNYFVSYGNLSQTGVIAANSNYDRNNIRFNGNTALTDKLHLATNMTFANIRSNRIQQGSNTSGVLLGELRTPPDYNNADYVGTYFNPDGLNTPNTQLTYRDQIGSTGKPGYDNPEWSIRNNLSYSVVNRFIGNIELTYDLAPWLSLKGNSGIDTYTDRRTDFFNAQSATVPGGEYQEQYIQESQWNTNLYALGNHTFSDAFKGSATLGFNYNNRQFNNVGAAAFDFIVPNAPPNLSNSSPSNRQPFNSAQTQRTAAAFVTATGEYKDQLFVTVTGRAESSSTFGPQAQSLFYYPSVNAAWQFSKITGTNDFFSFGKLRANYGVVGRQPSPYLNLTEYGIAGYTDGYGPSLNGSYYGAGGYGISLTAGNPKILPERKYDTEIGTDLRFFDSRVGFSFSAYSNTTKDAILPTQLAPSSGFAAITSNGGSIANKGLEFSLDPTWIRDRSGFTWSSNFIWSAYRNKVTSLGVGATTVFLNGFSDGASAAVQGKPLGVIFGTDYFRNANGTYTTSAETYGFPTVASNNTVLGNPNPQFRASFGNTLSYKGFKLYVLFDACIGGQMWNGTRGALTNFGTAASTATVTTVTAAQANSILTADGTTIANSNGWKQTNADGSVTFRGDLYNFGGGVVARTAAWYQSGGSGFSVNAPFVEKASWARMRELTLSYTFSSEEFRNSTKLTSLTVGVTGRNLLLWTPYSGIDPETNLSGATNGRGIDYFQNPNTKSFLFKLALNF